jgi:hypothetical protein
MAVAQGTPFYNILSGFSPDSTSLFPYIYGIVSGQVQTIDFRTFANYSTGSGSAPPKPSTTGDSLQYFTNISNGAPAGSAAETATQANVWGSVYAFASGDYGYKGPGATAGVPYGAGIGMFMPASGFIVVCEPSLTSQQISGGVSASSPGVHAILYVLDPLACKCKYDIIPALTGSPTYISGVFPCADGVHLLVLTGTAPSGFPTVPVATRWHILSLSSTAATETANGPWTAGPEQMNDLDNATNSVTIPLGCASCMNSGGLSNQTSTIVGMLESDLSHLWVVCSSSQFYVLALAAGSNYGVVFHGAGGRGGANPFVVWVNTGEFSPDIAMFADKGAGVGIVTNEMAYWTYLSAGASEIDVAKEAIAGDTSWRTIFCGFDVPRFTDLGLASGLTSSGNPVTGSSTVANNAGPYPIYYRKLGVSNPTLAPSASLVPAAAGSNAVNYLDTFDNPTQWNLPANTPNTGGAFVVVGGNPGAYMQVQSIGGATAIASKQFAVDQTAPFTVQTDFSFIRAFNARLQPSDFIFFVGLDTSVSGTAILLENQLGGVNVRFASISNGVIGPNLSTTFIASGSIPTWHTDADPTFTGFLQSTQWAHITIVVTPVTGATTSAGIAITVKVGATTAFTASATGMPVAGPGAGVGTFAPPESYPDWLQMKVDNFQVSGTGPAAATSNLSTTTYLYTLVNDLGEESGPSPVLLNTDGSTTITRPIGQGVQINLPATLVGSGADQTYFQVNPGTFIPSVQLNGITPSPSINLYRAVTGSSGTQLLLVTANVAFGEDRTVNTTGSTSTFGNPNTIVIDNLPDASLSQVIPSLFTLPGTSIQGIWAPPPTNMLGILALPNSIYAGFAGNNLCLSAQGIPHAWPLVYQLTFDYDIVAIQNVDTTVVVLTKNFPYLCSGNTPDNYSQTKATYPYACASKRSAKYLKGVGVVFASYEGLVAIAGVGNEKLLTEGLFSKREWLALNPQSMIADINDGRYFCFYTTAGGAQGGFYIDVQDSGAGKVSLGFHATARYNDPLTDILYLVPDFVDPAIPIGVPTQQIAAFDQPTQPPLPYVWKSKQFYVQSPTCFRYGRITGDSYANTVLTLFGDGSQYGTVTVTGQTEFPLPQPPNGTFNRYFEFQIAGTDTIDRVQLVEDIEEMTG